MNTTLTNHRGKGMGLRVRCLSVVLGAVALLLMAGVGLAAKVVYTYDGVGRLVAADYGNLVTTFLYDQNGNLLERTSALATNADVRLSKTSDVTGRSVGFNITYTLTVTNAGPTVAAGVTVTDPLPFGILLSSAAASQGTVSIVDRTVTAELGILPFGGSATVTLVMFHGITNSATNVAMVAATTPDPNLSNNTASRVTRGLGPINDSDNDGMPNWWETLNGLSFISSSGANGANGDLDRDGVLNIDEWLADTRPNDANSFFAVGDVVYVADSGRFDLSFLSSPIRKYVLEFTADLAQPFTAVQVVDGTGGVISLSHTSGTGIGFYRVQVQMP